MTWLAWGACMVASFVLMKLAEHFTKIHFVVWWALFWAVLIGIMLATGTHP